MPSPPRHGESARRGGFTLIELLVAVTLLIMLLAGTSYIFDTTVRAMDETMAINEMTADSPGFYDALRKDIRGIDEPGYLIELGYAVPHPFVVHGKEEPVPGPRHRNVE